VQRPPCAQQIPPLRKVLLPGQRRGRHHGLQFTLGVFVGLRFAMLQLGLDGGGGCRIAAAFGRRGLLLGMFARLGLAGQPARLHLLQRRHARGLHAAQQLQRGQRQRGPGPGLRLQPRAHLQRLQRALLRASRIACTGVAEGAHAPGFQRHQRVLVFQRHLRGGVVAARRGRRVAGGQLGTGLAEPGLQHQLAPGGVAGLQGLPGGLAGHLVHLHGLGMALFLEQHAGHHDAQHDLLVGPAVAARKLQGIGRAHAHLLRAAMLHEPHHAHQQVAEHAGRAQRGLLREGFLRGGQAVHGRAAEADARVAPLCQRRQARVVQRVHHHQAQALGQAGLQRTGQPAGPVAGVRHLRRQQHRR
jgi:hypothetical protein